MKPPPMQMEVIAVVATTAFYGAMGFFAHALATVKKLDYRKVVGGVLFAGFTSATACMLLMSIGVDPMMSSPLSAMLGSMGHAGFELLLKRFWETGGKS